MTGDLKEPGGFTSGTDLTYDFLRCCRVWGFEKGGDIDGWDIEGGYLRWWIGGWHCGKVEGKRILLIVDF